MYNDNNYDKKPLQQVYQPQAQQPLQPVQPSVFNPALAQQQQQRTMNMNMNIPTVQSNNPMYMQGQGMNFLSTGAPTSTMSGYNTTGTTSTFTNFQPNYSAKPPSTHGVNVFYPSNLSSNDLQGQMNTKKTIPHNEDEENEPPLLEELGINFSHIWVKTKSVLLPRNIQMDILEETDLAGPLVFGFLLGVFLLAKGKVHFGYIYGFGLLSCIFIYLLMNLMSKEKLIDIYRICSVLGYGLLPIVFLAGINILCSITYLGSFGFVLSMICSLWSTSAATLFFERAFNMQRQRYLIGYPILLVYSCFLLITIF